MLTAEAAFPTLTVYAVMRIGTETSVALFPDEDDARNYADDNRHGLCFVKRIDISVPLDGYGFCDVEEYN